jgi:hypothetical protein
MGSNEVSIVARVKKQQGHARHIAVTKLEREPTLERLAIAWSRLRFDAMSPAGPNDDDVPAASIARVGERDFGLEPKRSMETSPESLNQRGVRRVPHRFAARVNTQEELQPHSRQENGGTLD